MSHVRRGDTVAVIAGKERGKRGKVLRVLVGAGRVLVEKVNVIKKHQRPTQKLRQAASSSARARSTSRTCSSCAAAAIGRSASGSRSSPTGARCACASGAASRSTRVRSHGEGSAEGSTEDAVRQARRCGEGSAAEGRGRPA